MHFETSPSTSPAKPFAIRTMASPTGSVYSTFSHDTAASSRGSSCAYPSWPTGPSLGYRASPSSFISDEDLFPEELDEAPAPPREPPMPQALPYLPPIYAAPKKQEPKQRRRSSGRKPRRASKPMTPISESPESS